MAEVAGSDQEPSVDVSQTAGYFAGIPDLVAQVG
jgi:hypothetical protein